MALFRRGLPEASLRRARAVPFSSSSAYPCPSQYRLLFTAPARTHVIAADPLALLFPLASRSIPKPPGLAVLDQHWPSALLTASNNPAPRKASSPKRRKRRLLLAEKAMQPRPSELHSLLSLLAENHTPENHVWKTLEATLSQACDSLNQVQIQHNLALVLANRAFNLWKLLIQRWSSLLDRPSPSIHQERHMAKLDLKMSQTVANLRRKAASHLSKELELIQALSSLIKEARRLISSHSGPFQVQLEICKCGEHGHESSTGVVCCDGSDIKVLLELIEHRTVAEKGRLLERIFQLQEEREKLLEMGHKLMDHHFFLSQRLNSMLLRSTHQVVDQKHRTRRRTLVLNDKVMQQQLNATGLTLVRTSLPTEHHMKAHENQLFVT